MSPRAVETPGMVGGVVPPEPPLTRSKSFQRSRRRRSTDDFSLRSRRAREYLSIGWPVAVWSLGMPVLWLLGLYAYVWVLPAATFGLVIVAQPSRFRMPAGAVALGGFLVAAGVSGIRVGNAQGLVLFGYRWGVMVSLWACLVWFANQPRSRLPSAVVHYWMGLIFVGCVAFGYLTLVAGTFAGPSALQLVLPDGIANVGFIDSVSSLRVAEVTNYLGYTLARPSAPMAYANGWGSTMGLTLPFFFGTFVRSPLPRRRRFGQMVLALATVPAVLSFNRGLWMSVAVLFIYWAVRRAVGGDWTGVKVASVLTVIVALLLTFSPLGTLVFTKIETATDSNESREALYVDAWGGALEAPLIGWGTPTPQENAPPVGTHGLVWWIMYNHGFVALGLFVYWMARSTMSALRTRRDTEVWSAAVIMIFLVQFGFYGLLPQLPIVGVAAGLVQRDRWEREAGRRSERAALVAERARPTASRPQGQPEPTQRSPERNGA